MVVLIQRGFNVYVLCHVIYFPKMSGRICSRGMPVSCSICLDLNADGFAFPLIHSPNEDVETPRAIAASFWVP